MDKAGITDGMDATLALYDHTIDELTALYGRIDTALHRMPVLSIEPLSLLLTALLRLPLALAADVLLLPVTALIALRNLFFPGRWPYRCFACRTLRTALGWVAAGEALVPSVVLRSTVAAFVAGHRRRRFEMIRTALAQRVSRADAAAQPVYARLEALLGPPSPRGGRLAALWVPALLFPAAPLLANLSLRSSAVFVIIFIVVPMTLNVLCFFAVLAQSAFLAKRGLFLGAVGRDALFPGLCPGSGHYGQERALLARLGITAPEAPLDILFLGAVLVLGAAPMLLINWVQAKADPLAAPLYPTGLLLANVVVVSAVMAIAFVRRRLLMRL